jgi:hypothetical protein
MSKELRFGDAHGQAFIDRFSAIVNALPTHAAAYSWHIVRLYGEGDMPRAVGHDMHEILAIIERDGHFPLSWHQVQAMTRAMTQLFDLTLVATVGKILERRSFKDEPFQSLCALCELAIEAFDSEEWRVCGLDHRSLNAVAIALQIAT